MNDETAVSFGSNEVFDREIRIHFPSMCEDVADDYALAHDSQEMSSHFPSGIDDVADDHIYSSSDNHHSSVHFPSKCNDEINESILNKR